MSSVLRASGIAARVSLCVGFFGGEGSATLQQNSCNRSELGGSNCWARFLPSPPGGLSLLKTCPAPASISPGVDLEGAYDHANHVPQPPPVDS